jgi:Ni/Fe-hydrogenase 1 B-type cytochrome subunit
MSTQHALVEPAGGTTVYVYDATVRLWHWLNALCVLTLAATGYLIASPLASVGGEASGSFLMGYIRFTHFSAAYVFAVIYLVRVYWAFVGNEHAKELFVLPVFRGKWWGDLRHQLSWYLFMEPKAPKHVGHNPLGHLFMFLFAVMAFFMLLTGFALYSEGKGVGGWHDHVFGWLFPLFGGSQAVHSWHHLGMWMIVAFVIFHVYAAIREEVMSRQTMLSAIINGSRTFRD